MKHEWIYEIGVYKTVVGNTIAIACEGGEGNYWLSWATSSRGGKEICLELFQASKTECKAKRLAIELAKQVEIIRKQIKWPK